MTDLNRILDLRFFGLNAAGNIADRSGYGFDMTPTGLVGDDSEFMDGDYGQIIRLITNKYLSYTLLAGDRLAFVGGFTYEVWLSRRTFGADIAIMGKANGAGAGQRFAVLKFGAPDRLQFLAADGTTNDSLVGNTAITDTNLHHIVATFDTATYRLYIDGDEDNSGASVISSIDAGVGFDFSLNQWPGVGQSNSIDYTAARVYDRVMGAAEVKKNSIKGPNRT